MIIDGHHRYAICHKHNISFNTVENKDLETELDVKLWMINNQCRNLPTETRLALAYKFKEFEAEKAKARMQATQFKEVELDTARLPVTYPEQEEALEPSQSTDSVPVR